MDNSTEHPDKADDIKLVLNQLEHQFAVKKQRFHDNVVQYYRQNIYSTIVKEDTLHNQLNELLELKNRIIQLSNYILSTAKDNTNDFQYMKR